MTKRSPFRCFKTNPEVIRPAVMLYVRFPLSLRNVEDLLQERGIDVRHETIRHWWHRFGPTFAAEIRVLSEKLGLRQGRGAEQILGMTMSSPFRCFKTSPEVIRLAVILYIRFPLSLRNVGDLLHERGVDVRHETVRFWWHRFGPMLAAEIRKRRIEGMRSSRRRWHLDEMFVKINGEVHYLWRAVDHQAEVLESFVTRKRDKKAAMKFLRKTMRRHGQPEAIVTDKLRSHGAALREIGSSARQQTGRWANNRAENSHLPFRRRERAMLRFRRMRRLQKFAAVHASVFNHFNQKRGLNSRDIFKRNRTAALAEWRGLLAA